MTLAAGGGGRAGAPLPRSIKTERKFPRLLQKEAAIFLWEAVPGRQGGGGGSGARM